MTVSANQVKELREKTGAGFMDCKQALTETKGNFEEAIDLLRKKGVVAAAKRKGKEANQGGIASYIHPGAKIGVLLEINCETDFVARTDDFTDLQKDIAMHIAAAAPKFLSPDQIPQKVLDKEKEIFAAQAKESGKPDNIVPKIVEGRLKKFYAETCLLEQPFVKDEDRKIQEVIDEVAGKLGENIRINRFCRYELGETSTEK